MSYEGYEQHLCTNGHRFDAGEHWDGEPRICDDCGAGSAFCNDVDETNCDGVGVIPNWDAWLIDAGPPEVYRIPTEEEHRAARCCTESTGPGQWLYHPLEDLT